MKRMIAALVLAHGLAPSAGLAATAFAPDEANALQAGLTQIAQDFALPAYQSQSMAAHGLAGSLAAYCDDTGDLEAVHGDYAHLFLAWQRASIIQIGAVMQGDGPLRFQLWPDPKGFSRRAVQAAVRSKDAGLLADGGLADRSIALKNLTALERLVHDDLLPDTFACDLATAVALYQAEQADGLVADWTEGADFRTAFDTAAQGNNRYADVDSLTRELLAGMVVQANRIKSFQILRGLGDTPGSARIERSEARASGLGLASIATTLQAFGDLLALEGGLFERATQIGASENYLFLGAVLTGIAADLAALPPALDDVYAQDADTAADLRNTATLLGFHEEFLKVTFPSSIGLTAGFTSADGD